MCHYNSHPQDERSLISRANKATEASNLGENGRVFLSDIRETLNLISKRMECRLCLRNRRHCIIEF